MQTKLRLLRRLFQEDKKEGREYRPPYKFEQELDKILTQVDQIKDALQEGVDPKLVSRLRHYYLRVKRGEAAIEEVEDNRKKILKFIKETLRECTDALKESADDETDQDGKSKDPNKTGAKPKQPLPPPKDDKDNTKGKGKQPTYEELQQHIQDLRNTVKRLKKLNTEEGQDDTSKAHEKVGQAKPTNKKSARDRSQTTESDSSEQETRKDNGRGKGRGSRNRRVSKAYRGSDESDRGIDERRDRRNNGDRDREDNHRRRDRNRDRIQDRRQTNDERSDESRSPSNDRTSGSDRYRGRHGRDFRQFRRIEHWKLSFSGDNRTVSVENFLYKLKKIAERERVSERSLLRDIHLILEGQASDWFFTYVDEFEDWEDFEERIRFRFGNPNQDQGIRQRIQERKQHRGESFNAFVSEIERLNKMLSKPLSSRRKFEVVWDNMRPHYRSKISIVRVRDLDHLISLNHRIDAADSSFQQHQDSRNSEPRNHRNVHEVECASSEDGSEESEAVDAIEARPNHRDQRRRSQPTTRTGGTAPVDQQRTTQTSSLNVCWNCRKAGHNWRDCKEPRAIFCYGCGELGRTIRSCQRCAGSSRRKSEQNQGNQ